MQKEEQAAHIKLAQLGCVGVGRCSVHLIEQVVARHIQQLLQHRNAHAISYAAQDGRHVGWDVGWDEHTHVAARADSSSSSTLLAACQSQLSRSAT